MGDVDRENGKMNMNESSLAKIWRPFLLAYTGVLRSDILLSIKKEDTHHAKNENAHRTTVNAYAGA